MIGYTWGQWNSNAGAWWNTPGATRKELATVPNQYTHPRQYVDRVCPQCSTAFVTHRPKRVYCSRVCAGLARRVPLLTRFEQAVDRSPGADACHLWTAGLDDYGYGSLRGEGANPPLLRAHRLAWEIAHGAIPDGIFVCHRCDVRACVNPAHLFLGDHEDNTLDMVQKGRTAQGERVSSARLTAEAVIAMRELHAATGATFRQIAQRFNVSQTTARNAILRVTWDHVA